MPDKTTTPEPCPACVMPSACKSAGQCNANPGTARYAVTALLMKKTETGFNWQLMLDVVHAADERSARADFGLRAKDAWPEHGLHEVLAVEVAGG